MHEQVLTLLNDFGHNVHLLRDPTRGGVATVLNEIARQTHLGMTLDAVKIPVAEQVQAACEMPGLDPLFVANEGIFMVWVKEKASKAVLEKLQEITIHQQAAMTGTILADYPGQVVLQTTFGGRSVVAMPSGEQLPRIC